MQTDKRRCGVIALGTFLGVIAMLVGTAAARAQNLDEGKSPSALFANGCAACHKSPRGLARGRIRLQLFMFLKDHYATSSNEAWALSSYLDAAGEPPRGKPRTGAAKPPHGVRRDGDPVVRPPAPVR
jgi:hypothetical protein